ncbi:Smr/MutS family protein [Sphingomonas sp. IC4-52]|uniref:Smr/MutS family protein n=1 Tax=Sphingomonas sp. IC4-52 TaxID=2887202 RepID=UPI001D104D6D|nr:Smr/MutS family protein [Sphingomonas sp. IC4-52]MCC2980174.1 Smr/MutS family protein [Sphingomonas sp. IC4-52]
MATVRPLRAVAPAAVPKPAPVVEPPRRPVGRLPTRPLPAPKKAADLPKRPLPGITLDAGWDKKLARGLVTPDATIDLHGHTLHSAHDLLDGALARSVARGDRVILLVTGKPPRPESERPHARGAIRAAIGDWLAGSRHAGSIAAVRGAHPRHGGQGALYIVLRRFRG